MPKIAITGKGRRRQTTPPPCSPIYAAEGRTRLAIDRADPAASLAWRLGFPSSWPIRSAAPSPRWRI